MSNDAKDVEQAHQKLDLKQYAELQAEITKNDMQRYIKSEIDKRFSYYIRWGLFILAFSGITSYWGIKNWMKTYKDTVNAGTESFKASINIKLEESKKAVQERIDDEFKKPNIKALVEQEAQEYAGKYSREYIESQVKMKIEPYVRTADSRINEIGISVLEAKAYNDDKDSFDKLVLLNRQGNKDPSIIQTIETIAKLTYSDYYKHTNLIHQQYDMNGKLVPADSLTLDTLFSYLENPRPSVNDRRAVMYAISKKPKKEMLQFALKTLKYSKSIIACASTTQIVIDVLNKKGDYMDFAYWVKIIDNELHIN